MVNTIRGSALFLGAFLCLATPNLVAQNLRCQAVPDRCVELDSTGSATITLPSNTTRINSNALAICMSQVISSNTPDLMFVVDQSGSMSTQDRTYYAPDATKKGLAALDSLSPNSTAGIIPFGSIVCAETGPTPLAGGGLLTLQTWAENNLARSSGELGCRKSGSTTNQANTNYVASLTRGDALVRTGPNKSKALIFITDGAPTVPTGSGSYDNWTGKNSLVATYPIFIGGTYADTSDRFTANGRLHDLAKRTGGRYFAVQANQPKQLDSVIALIVNTIINIPVPTLTRVLNTTNNQSATATLHTTETSSRFRLSLDNFIALNAGTNLVRVTTSYQTGAGPQPDKVKDININVTGPVETTLSNNLLTPDSLVNLQCVPISTVSATDLSFNVIDTIFYPMPQFGVELKPGALIPNPTVNITTKSGDTEASTVVPLGFNYRDNMDFAIAAAAASDNEVQSTGWGDSVYLAWVHARDPRDMANDTVPVRPARKQAAIIFTADAVSTTPITQMAGTETVAYVLVTDQDFHPDSAYTVVFTTVRHSSNSTIAPDGEMVTLTATATPGQFRAQVPLSQLAGTNGDGTLQILRNDQIVATYKDPVDGDSAVAQIGYGIKSEAPGQLVFTDDTYSAWPTGNFWDLNTKFVYLKYTDDAVAGLNKSISFHVSNSYPASIIPLVDSDNTLTMTPASPGVWHIQVPITDNHVMTGGNGILEIFFKGLITATVRPHLNATVETLDPSALPATATLTVAYPNKPDTINLIDPTNITITRQSDSIKICVAGQVFSSSKIDTVFLQQINCAGDKVDNVMLIQTTATTGQYCGTIKKTEGIATSGDNILTCIETDKITAIFKDPVYTTITSIEVPIDDTTRTVVTITDLVGNPISTAVEGVTGNQFKVVVTAKDPNLNSTDTLFVTLTTPDGDRLVVRAIETSPGKFVTDPINFGFSITPSTSNGIIEGKLNPSLATNQTTVTATVGTATDNLVITAAFVPVSRSWIIDNNGDGVADSIYMVFIRPISQLPTTITSIDWPNEGIPNQTANSISGDIKFVGNSKDTIVIAIDKADSLKLVNKTAIDPLQTIPTLTLPPGPLFQGVRVPIQDGMGAVVTRSIKTPSDLTLDPTNTKFKPDTFQITISEPITPLTNSGTTPWQNLFRFSSTCGDKSTSKPLVIDGIISISADSTTWVVIVDTKNSVAVGECIFMSTIAPYQDKAGNKPAQGSVPVEGLNSPKIIKSTYVYNPVVGLPISVLQHHSFTNDTTGGYRNLIGVQVVTGPDGKPMIIQQWIPPVGFNKETGTVGPKNCNSTTIEMTTFEAVPTCISSIKVESDYAYRAEVRIYDNLGKFLHESVQTFGDCGELQNTLRRQVIPGRQNATYNSWLVWDMKTPEGKTVGNGVYIWKVKFSTLNASVKLPPQTSIYRQGVALNFIDDLNGGNFTCKY